MSAATVFVSHLRKGETKPPRDALWLREIIHFDMVSGNHGDHVDEEILERYALGRLNEVQAAPVEEHLLVCQWCQDALGAADEYIRTVRAAAPKLASELKLDRAASA